MRPMLQSAAAMIALAAATAFAGPAFAARSAVATIADASGAAMATATITQTRKGLKLVVTGKGMPAGAHGLHIHTVGKCEAPGFTTAGGHWNPTGKQHGHDNPAGAHMGDLPNLEIGADGTGHVEAMIAGGMLGGGANPLLDADGAAIVVHAASDDYKTDPSGNSGARIACGVFAAK